MSKIGANFIRLRQGRGVGEPTVVRTSRYRHATRSLLIIIFLS